MHKECEFMENNSVKKASNAKGQGLAQPTSVSCHHSQYHDRARLLYVR